jgi:outer membrane protein OmpA-like peptidoglycan-associated protein
MRSTSKLGVVRCLSALLVVAVTMTACANGGPNPIACAAVGAILGAGGGGAAGTHAGGSHDDAEIYGYGVAGGVLLGTAGYFICKALQADEEAPPAPPAPMPPRERGEAPPPMSEKIVLRGVNFDFDKSNIRPDAAVILDEAVRILGTGGGSSVIIEGHTDWIGTDAYNQGLSERRANSVMEYLADHGVAASRLSTAGFGESRPIASNQTREGRALNRRVELHVQE